MSTGQIAQADLALVLPVNASDAATKAYVDTLILNAIDNKAFKFPVRTGVTAKNVGDIVFGSFSAGSNTLTTTSAISIVDGITLAVNDRVGIFNFTSSNAPYNGIYTCTTLAGTSQFVRSTDAITSNTNTWTDLIVGSTVIIEDGAMNANTLLILQPPAIGTDTITINTSSLNWLSPGAVVPAWFAEVPAGTVNGANSVFTLSRAPIANSLQVMLRRQVLLAGTEYTLSGSTVTFNSANVRLPNTGDDLFVRYQA